MGKSIRDQMVGRGIVKADETPEAKRAQAIADRPPEPEKTLPPPFEAAARGVIVEKRAHAVAARSCVTCGVEIPPGRRSDPSGRCLECSGHEE